MIDGALTANELALLRTRPQRTQLYLAIPDYTAVYTAIKDGTPTNNDNTVSVPFKTGVGVITDVKFDMMLLVSSVGYGLWDAGIARIRKSGLLGDDEFYIGITSDIDFADGMFLTVVNDYSLWPRHPYIDPVTEVVYMDYDTPYVAQNTYGPPVVIMGTHAVLELTGATVTANFDATDSYCPIGTPLSYEYLWACDGATVVTPNAASSDFIFNAAGTYVINVRVTAVFNASVTITSIAFGRRYVVVYDAANPLNSSFILDSCSGDYDSGNWSYRVTMRDNADEVDVRDRTLCMLVAKDWYGDTQQSIGPVDGRENIVCSGWVDGDSIRRSNDRSSVSFEVQGPVFWLGVQEGFPTGVDDTNTAPADWLHIENLTARKGLYTFLQTRTTSTTVMDCFITDDAHRLASTYTPAGSLLDQLRAICQKINAKAVCNRYGQLYCEIDTQFIAPGSRVAPPGGEFPVVQTLTDRDWREEIMIERKAKSSVGQVDLSGVYYSGDFTTSTAIFSLAPGHYPRHYGSKHKVERIALANQIEANLLAGLWLSYLNNEYPAIDVPLSSNHRAIDIAPWSFVQMNMAASDTPRGIAWVNRKLIPRRVTFNYDAGEAVLLTDVEFESETFASEAITGDPPIEPPEPPPPPPPPSLCNDPLAINFGLPAPCIYIVPATSDIVVVMTGTKIAWSDNAISTPASANWTDITPAGMASGLVDCVLADTGELWLACHSVVGDAYEGIWYTSDLRTVALSRILSTTTARTDIGKGGGDGSVYFDKRCLCMLGTECLTTCEESLWDTVNFHYWHGNGTLTHAACNNAIAVGGTSVNGTSCTSGTLARFGMNSGARNSWVMDAATCTQIWQAFPWPIGGNLYSASENYAVNDNKSIYPVVNGGAWAALYTDAHYDRALLEFDGHLYWTRFSDSALMQDGIVQAIANDAGLVNGVFSTVNAFSGSYVGVGTTATLIWIASSTDGNNSRCNMALTQDGGVTWNSIDGDWNAAVSSYDGGLTVRYAAVT